MENYLALYRRYRPSTFDGLIGQEHIVKTLVNQIKNNRLGHAYLFTGTRGTGKTSVAKIFAKAINCLHPINGSPCGECEVCKALQDPSNIDVIEIDAASNNGVNEIRDLREKVQYPPVSCSKKVYIVDEVHMLTGAAFNALLKTLEEPPTHAVFILATTEVHKIPATILSRCMRFDFRLVSTEVIAKHIAEIFDKENKMYDYEAIYAIAKAGEGSVRDALSVADICISCGDDKLTYEDVINVLGSSGTSLLNEYMYNLLSGNVGGVMDSIEKLCSLGKSIGVLIKDVCSYLRDLIIVKNCQKPNEILGLPDAYFLEIKKVANLTNSDRLLRSLDIFSMAENDLRYSNHQRVVLETASIKCCRPETDYNIDALLARIKTLEEQVKNGVKLSIEDNAINEPLDKPEIKQETEKKSLNISDLSLDDLKGKILSGLRSMGREMLWNIFQGVSISVSGNVLTVNVADEGDFDLLSREDNKRLINDSLEGFNPFQLEICRLEQSKMISEIDNATERMKKIFGEDIIIIKE